MMASGRRINALNSCVLPGGDKLIEPTNFLKIALDQLLPWRPKRRCGAIDTHLGMGKIAASD
jgi:hypothetical protein